jgi:hypothetical protein
MNRELVHEYQTAQAALREAEDKAFIALEAEHAAELARIEAKFDASTVQLRAQLTAALAEIEKLKGGVIVTPPDEEEPPPDDDDDDTETPPRTEMEDVLYQRAEVMNRPTTGKPWELLAAMAKRNWSTPNLGDNNSQADAEAVAGALYAVRMNDSAMRDKAVNQLKAAINSRLTRTLELGRGLAGYVIAANLIQYADPAFVTWVHAMVTRKFGSGDRWGSFDTILATDHGFNSNWATQCRRSVICASMYLKQVGTDAQKADAEKWLKLSVLAHKRDIGVPGRYPELPPLLTSPTGWSGDADPVVGINPPGTKKEISGKVRNLDGVRPADWLRSKGPEGEDREAKYWPTNPVTYHWEGLTPQVVTAMILHQHRLCAFDEADNAIVRAMNALYGRVPNDPPFNNPAGGDDKLCPWVVNRFAGEDFPTVIDDMPDKAGHGWMAWYLGGAS